MKIENLHSRKRLSRPVFAAELAVILLLSACLPPGEDGSEVVRRIEFSGYGWEVKSADKEPLAPGPNYFSDSTAQVNLDNNGWLHMNISYRNGAWRTAEVINEAALGYGKYVFYTDARLDLLDTQAVLGLFTWDPAASSDHYREVDIEFSRWGDNSATHKGQYVVQPFDVDPDTRRNRFDFDLTGDLSTHIIDWNPSELSFHSYHGELTDEEIETGPIDNNLIQTWSYSGTPPETGGAHARMNLWLYRGEPPQNPATPEHLAVVIRSFRFFPL